VREGADRDPRGAGFPRLHQPRAPSRFDWTPLLFAARAEGCPEVERTVAELMLKGGLADPREGLWVLAEASEVVGAGALFLDPCPDLWGAGRIGLFYLVPKWRGKGHAGRLLRRMLRHAKGRFRRVTAAAEGAFAGFLEHHGFVPFSHPCVSHFRPVGRWR